MASAMAQGIASFIASSSSRAAVGYVSMTPDRTHGTTDGAADEGATPVTHAVVVTADVESRLETVHEKNSL